MPVIYDLHSHSWVSDGTLSPAELVARAHAAGVDVLALTDHDDTAGLEEAGAAASRLGVQLVPGAEISVTWERMTVHVVGLGIDARTEALSAGLARLREFRHWRAQEIGRRLERHGIGGAFEGARALARGQSVSRTHFARFLAESGHAKDTREAFRRLLRSGRPGHVPGRWAALEEAVGWIRGAGGAAVLAHPARYGLTATRLRRLCGEFVECGGAALEVVSGSYSVDDCHTMARYARNFELAASVGSDYHGPENPWVELGRLRPLPEGCRPIWEAWPLAPQGVPASRASV
jgi:predicted metal-dependent phosphoesterase TrpH